ncbi:hypothetical protein BTI09_05395 [Lactobacillus delbrueckii subsp. bulgaricus]|nr:hypothetical protein [Lactobacillus delbrueckii subsp. bulgaricus]MBT9001231.1 hypothetical protein [Lactobacillus delbrueckii subsp. bulgaricus]
MVSNDSGANGFPLASVDQGSVQTVVKCPARLALIGFIGPSCLQLSGALVVLDFQFSLVGLCLQFVCFSLGRFQLSFYSIEFSYSVD